MASVAPSAIPYRTDAPVSAGNFVVALLVTVGLLGLLTTALIFIRRRGWLNVPGAARVSPSAHDIQLRSSRRLSMVTTVHVVTYQDRNYLVVESSRGTNVTIAPAEPSHVPNEGRA